MKVEAELRSTKMRNLELVAVVEVDHDGGDILAQT